MSGLDIRAARIAAGYNQSELAEKLGVAQTTVSAWERGRPPTTRDLIALARILGVGVHALFADAPTLDDLEAAYWAGWDDCAAAVTATARRGRTGG